MLMEILNPEEARVLGTLIEKSLATPEYYPMTMNSLRAACNQKTCREPVSAYDETIIMSALTSLKSKCYIRFIPYGSRHGNFKFAHFLDDARFGLDSAELALIALLLLRGPQTLNELKTRSATMHDFSDVNKVEKSLHRLAELDPPVTQFLPKRVGWKEPRWRHLFYGNQSLTETGDVTENFTDDLIHTNNEFEKSKKLISSLEETTSTPLTISTISNTEIENLRAELDSLKSELSELRTNYAETKDLVDQIHQELYGNSKTLE